MSRFTSQYSGPAEAEQRATFARVVARELRDPLMIADATLKQVGSDLDSDQFATIAEAHVRMSQLLEDLSAFVQCGTTVRDVQPVDLETVTRRRWERLKTGDATLTVDSTYQPQAEPQLFGLLISRLLKSLLDYALLSHRSNVNQTDRTEPARSDTEYVVKPRPIVVSPSKTSNGHGFYVGVGGGTLPPTASCRSVSVESVAGSEIKSAIDIAMEIVSSHGWSMRMVRGDNGIRIEVTTSDAAPQ